jgi:hypothetical protein
MRIRLVSLAVLFAACVAAGPAAADEVKTPISASMLLSIVNSGVESRDVAFDEALRDAGPAPASTDGVMQPDGSVRYGRTTVSIVRNPCPPGTAHYEPPPLPGRRARN